MKIQYYLQITANNTPIDQFNMLAQLTGLGLGLTNSHVQNLSKIRARNSQLGQCLFLDQEVLYGLDASVKKELEVKMPILGQTEENK